MIERWRIGKFEETTVQLAEERYQPQFHLYHLPRVGIIVVDPVDENGENIMTYFKVLEMRRNLIVWSGVFSCHAQIIVLLHIASCTELLVARRDRLLRSSLAQTLPIACIPAYGHDARKRIGTMDN